MASIYQHNYIELIGGLIIVSLGIILLIRNRQALNSYKTALPLIIWGILSVPLSTVLNSIIASRWDRDYIIAFLLLKKIDGGGWLCRGPAFVGYTLFIFGITILLIVRSTRLKGS